jgi:hypothetical protein
MDAESLAKDLYEYIGRKLGLTYSNVRDFHLFEKERKIWV